MSVARRTSVPLVAAVVAGVVAVALAIVYFVAVRDDASASPSSADKGPLGALTTRERTALAAARTESLNLQTFTRATFAKDWARAVAGATGALKSDLSADRRKQTLDVLTKNKIDLAADFVSGALVGPTDTGKGYIVLVVMNGYRVSSGKRSTPVTQRLQLTMVEKQGKWFAAQVSQRGIS